MDNSTINNQDNINSTLNSPVNNNPGGFSNANQETEVINTELNRASGNSKCPNCGSSDIGQNIEKNLLICKYCGCEFTPETFDSKYNDITSLKGRVIGSGSQDIDDSKMITLRCKNCGAEIVFGENNAANGRCHWCRSTITLDDQVPNGAVPDTILPFSVTKDEARKCIEKFVGSRKTFADKTFKKEFKTDNIMGVYFPYMLVDINAHSTLQGIGGHVLRSYSVEVSDDREETRYDIELSNVRREFDIAINSISIESNSTRLDNSNNKKTNNVINAIMPFDTEKCVKWNASYLNDFTLEKRDSNIDDLTPIVHEQAKDIARFAANESLSHYDSGVRWTTDEMNVIGEQWISAYLPVWLYSYLEVKKGKQILHYVAVNGRTKETMGSVPINKTLLWMITIILEIFGLIGVLVLDDSIRYLLLSIGIIFYFIIMSRYRNKSKRHNHEKETKNMIRNLQCFDQVYSVDRNQSSSMISGANNKSVNGATNKSNSFSKALKDSLEGPIKAAQNIEDKFTK